MKKIISVLTIIVVLIIWNTISYAAALQATIKITPNSTEVKQGDIVTFSMQLVNVSNAEGGIVGAISGIITYDTNFFEELTYSGITMNESTGKFTKMDSFTNNSNIGTITLKVKSNATGTGNVNFTELAANDGRDDYEEGEATTPNETFNITIKEENKEGETNSTNNDDDKSDTSNNSEDSDAHEIKDETNNSGNQEENNPSNNEDKPNPSNNEGESNNSNDVNEENKQVDTNKKYNTNVEQDMSNNVTDKTSKNIEDNKSDNGNKATGLPKTGNSVIIIPFILVGAIFSIIMLKKYKEYKKI